MDFTNWDAGLHMKDPNSLQHYGVLGMKWGQRRFQNSDGSLTAAGKKHYEKTGEYGYHYKSHTTKKYDRKAARALKKGNAEKAAKMKKRADRSREIDRREQNAASKISVGKAMVSRLLLGGAASKSYQQYNAVMGGNPGKSEKIGNAIMSYIGIPGHVAKAAYIRKGEKNHGVYNAINKSLDKQKQRYKKADKKIARIIKSI